MSVPPSVHRASSFIGLCREFLFPTVDVAAIQAREIPVLQQLAHDQRFMEIANRITSMSKGEREVVASLLVEPFLGNGRSVLTSVGDEMPRFFSTILARISPDFSRHDGCNETPLHSYARWFERTDSTPIGPNPEGTLKRMLALGAPLWERDAFGELPFMRIVRSELISKLDLLQVTARSLSTLKESPFTPAEFQESLLRLVANRSALPSALETAMITIGSRFSKRLLEAETREPCILKPETYHAIAAKVVRLADSLPEFPATLVERMVDFRRVLLPISRKKLLNEVVTEKDGDREMPLFVRMYRAMSPGHSRNMAIQSCLDFGADPFAMVPLRNMRGTLLHDPVILQNPVVVKFLLNIFPDVPIVENRSPVEVALEMATEESRKSAEILLSVVTLENRGEEEKKRIFESALRSGPALTILDFLERGLGGETFEEKRWTIPDYASKSGANTRTVDCVELLYRIHDLEQMKVLPHEVKHAAYQVGYATGNLFHTWLYLMAALEVVGGADSSQGEHFNQLLPHLVALKSPVYAMPLVSWHDLKAEGRKKSVHEAEIMGLLSNDHLTHDHLERLSYSFTAPSLIYKKGIDYVSGRVLDAWRMAGVEANDFIRYKWDTRTTKPINDSGLAVVEASLFEEFGHRPYEYRARHVKGFYLPAGVRPWRDTLAENTVAPRIEDSTSVVHLHGFKVFLMPGIGSMYFRNSSRTFGRDQMVHAAGYAQFTFGSGFSERDLLTDPKGVLREFSPLHGQGALLKDVENRQCLHKITTEAFNLRAEYSRWKFDTNRETAFSTLPDGTRVMTGGFASPGFKHIVRLLDRAVRERDIDIMERGESYLEDPFLAFFPLRTPAWQPFPFTFRKEVFHAMPIDFDRLELLEAIAEDPQGSFGSKAFMRKFREFGLFPFFQEAGFQTQGDLVVISSTREG